MVSVTLSHGSVDVNSLAAQGLSEQRSERGTSLCSLPPVAWGVLEGVPALLMVQAPAAMGAGGGLGQSSGELGRQSALGSELKDSLLCLNISPPCLPITALEVIPLRFCPFIHSFT